MNLNKRLREMEEVHGVRAQRGPWDARQRAAIYDLRNTPDLELVEREDCGPTPDGARIYNRKVESTLRDAAELPITFDVVSQSFAGEQALLFRVDLVERYPTSPNPVGFGALVNDTTHRRDFLVNIECRAVDASGQAKTDVNIKVQCRRTNGQMFGLASLDGEGAVSSGRNDFGETHCYWHIPNSIEDLATTRVDPSRIEIYATSDDNQPFTIKFDLIQLIPVMQGPAHIVALDCVPPIDLSATATTIQGTVFRDDGLLVAWNQEITSVGDDGAGPQFVRVYRSTGDPDHPLADITCATYQELESIGTPPTPRGVRIWYKPNPSGQTHKLPAGAYEVSVFDRGDAQLNSVCEDRLYRKLYTVMSGPIERDPVVASEHFAFSVPYAGPTGPVAPEDCYPPRDCLADVDGGAGDGVPDNGVTIDDLLYYLAIFEAGYPCADVDDGSFTGTLDAGVTIDDLLYFLYRFELGC